MIQFSKRFNLSKLNAFIPISVFLLHFFDSHDFSSLNITGFVDSTEGPISQCFYSLVLLHEQSIIINTIKATYNRLQSQIKQTLIILTKIKSSNNNIP